MRRALFALDCAPLSIKTKHFNAPYPRKCTMPMGVWFALLAVTIGTLEISSLAISQTRREIAQSDIRGWRALGDVRISSDGQRLAYADLPDSGQGKVFIEFRDLSDATTRRFAAGEMISSAASLRMSKTGEWLSFAVQPVVGGQRDVALVDTRTGARRDFTGVAEFDIIGTMHQRLILSGYAAANGKYAVTLVDLQTGQALAIGDVSSHAVSPNSNLIALVESNGIRIYDSSNDQTFVIESNRDGGTYVGLSWAPDGNSLAFLHESAKGRTQKLVAIFDVGHARRRTSLQRGTSRGLPDLDIDQPLIQWRSDGKSLYLGYDVPAGRNLSARDDVRIWHWRHELPGARDTSSTVRHWGFVDLNNRTFTRLTDDVLREVLLPTFGDYAVGFDSRAYGWQNIELVGQGGAKPQKRDYYRINLRSGLREMILKALPVWTRSAAIPVLSPDGRYLVYQHSSGEFIARNVKTSGTVNLTSALPTRFRLPENEGDRFIRNRLALPIQGWTLDGEHVLISDQFDVWAVPLRGENAMRLTTGGRADNRSYTIDTLSGAQIPLTNLDLSRTLHFTFRDWDTLESGLVSRQLNQEMRIVHSEPLAELEYFKAEHSNTLLVTRATATDTRNIFQLDVNAGQLIPVTNVNAQQMQLSWFAGARYLSYQNRIGQTRHAALLLPAGYREGRSYPTVVMIYTILSQQAARNVRPTELVFRLLQRGYAVLLPDIQVRMDQTGQAAVDDVVAAVQEAAKIGVVDESRLGLFGHSFGGYETNFIVSKTDIFRAALAWAGMANLWSHCGAVYMDHSSGPTMCERTQPYLSGPWWEKWNEYLENSPLFHARNIRTPLLLVHGSEDNAVHISQSYELFNALRRIGDRPVVLLELRNQGHLLHGTARQTLDSFALEFFDHFLLQEPAPSWWSRGTLDNAGSVKSH